MEHLVATDEIVFTQIEHNRSHLIGDDIDAILGSGSLGSA